MSATNNEGVRRCGYVTLIGAPNAGKSTIVNNFVGSKVSIVTPKMQTTRTMIRGIGIFENTQIIFQDTPGIFKMKRRLDRSMVDMAWTTSQNCDIVVLVIDAKKGLDKENQAVINEINSRGLSPVLVLNKIDTIAKQKLLPLAKLCHESGNFSEIFMVSAQTGENLADFYRYLADNLPESPWLYPEEQMSEMPLKYFAAEIVREKMFMLLQAEIPYSLTVEPLNWVRRADDSVKAEMNIYVEREGQKRIVIGQGGQMIKKIGEKSRLELEKLLECPVHLFLYVKVREKWMEDPARYKDWGLNFDA
ncbi:MAG: GTPase Era [Alphaproteobacteria bacterium]|nr:GTPase Era [Alphaproteobacteria bacterium]